MTGNFWGDLLVWLLSVAFFIWIKKQRGANQVKTFQYLPEEKVEWLDTKVEVSGKRGKRPFYRTYEVTFTNQRILFAQFGFFEEIWDFTHPEKPAQEQFKGKYYCLPQKDIVYEKTFRGKQTLFLNFRVDPEDSIQLELELTDRESPYPKLFGPKNHDEGKEEIG